MGRPDVKDIIGMAVANTAIVINGRVVEVANCTKEVTAGMEFEVGGHEGLDSTRVAIRAVGCQDRRNNLVVKGYLRVAEVKNTDTSLIKVRRVAKEGPLSLFVLKSDSSKAFDFAADP